MGVMTGTSVDAIDIAALSIDHESYKLLNAKSYPFPENLKNKILEYSRNQENIDDNKARSLGDQLAHVYAKSIEAFICLLYTSPSPRDKRQSRMPSSA